MFSAKVNDRFDIPSLAGAELDIIPQADGTYHLLHEGQSYHIEIESADFAKKRLQLRLNHRRYDVQLADEFDRLVDQLGFSAKDNQRQTDVKAPMPGLVLDILVEPGQSVTEGETLLVLEAMKMENAIKTTTDAVIKAVHTETGAAVEKGSLLIELE